MPCLCNYAHCNKTRCDTDCRTCQYYVAGRGSRAYDCGLPADEDCIDLFRRCPECIWHIPDRRFVEDDDPRTKQKRYRDNHPRRENKRKKLWRNKLKNKQKLAEKARLRRAQKWIKN